MCRAFSAKTTVLDTSVHPPRVSKLDFVIEGWCGADIVESFPVFLVTEALAETLADSGLGAFELRDAEVTVTRGRSSTSRAATSRTSPSSQSGQASDNFARVSVIWVFNTSIW